MNQNTPLTKLLLENEDYSSFKYNNWELADPGSYFGPKVAEIYPEKEEKLQTYEIRNIFREKFKGCANIMTPHIIRYGKKGQFIYELSKGEGFNRETIWGVTVLTLQGEETKLSRCESSIEQAENLINSLG